MPLPTTYLFVPGNRPERFDKAMASGAGAVIVDLEDAVAPAEKAGARATVAAWYEAAAGAAKSARFAKSASSEDAAPAADIAAAELPVLIRINDVTTPWFEDDLAMLREAAVRAVMLPKCEQPEQVTQVLAAMPAGAAVMALIETARGLLNVERIAAAPGVSRLAFGTLDYAVDLDLSDDPRGLLYPASRIAIASRAAGIASPVAGVTPDIRDEARLLAELSDARACGFGAKLCIHPTQVAWVRQALRPSAADVQWADRVIAAAESSSGAVQLDGKMVDRPVLLKARAILDRAAD